MGRFCIFSGSDSDPKISAIIRGPPFRFYHGSSLSEFHEIHEPTWLLWVLGLHIIYNFFRLLNSPVKKKALEGSLRERVTNHKSIYFASGWSSYGTARKGSLKLVPPSRVVKKLQ
jgi:hypothetical protein